MAVQSNYTAVDSSTATWTCNFTGIQTAGNCNVVFVSVASFGTLTDPAITDTNLNTYVKVASLNVGSTAGDPNCWAYVATGIAAASAGANTVQIVIGSGPAFDPSQGIIIAEVAASSVSVANSFESANTEVGSVSLNPTNLNDYVISMVAADIGNTLGTGNIGSNTANLVINPIGSFLAQDGLSSGGNIAVTTTCTTFENLFSIAIDFVPQVAYNATVLPTDAVFFGMI